MTTIHAEAIWDVGPPQPQVIRHGMLRLPAHLGHDADDGDCSRRQGGTARSGRASWPSARSFSPLQMAQQQAEGLLICAEYGQPLAMSPEGIAGATSPVTLAGLLAQENAGILAHIVACADLPARHARPVRHRVDHRQYAARHGGAGRGGDRARSRRHPRSWRASTGCPCRSVGGATESKTPGRAGGHRAHADAAARGAGGREPDHLRRHAGQHLAGTPRTARPGRRRCAASALRLARGIEVDDETLALDLIRSINHSGNYLAEPHTVAHFRSEHYQPKTVRPRSLGHLGEGRLPDRASTTPGTGKGDPGKHRPRDLDPAVEAELAAVCETVMAARSLEEFYSYELPELQRLEAI